MRVATFSDTEIGDDFIVSFYLVDEADPSEGYSLILMRSPKYEHFLYEEERRPRVTCEGEELEDDQYLVSVEFNRQAETLKIVGTIESYELDVRKLEEAEIGEFVKGFKRLNFDRKFEYKET